LILESTDGNKNIIVDILKSHKGNRVSGDKGWGRKKGEGAPLTVAFIEPEEYDRQLDSRKKYRQAESFPLAVQDMMEDIVKIASKGYKSNIGTVVNMTDKEIYELTKWLKRSFYNIPLLIPQVWRQYIQYEPNDPLYENVYSSVDFALFWNGKKVVFEIDGPIHYSVWDKEQKTWKISEEAYTRNLARERKLRTEGWIFIRISNQEIEQAQDWYDIEDQINIDRILSSYYGGKRRKDYPDYYYF
jgi:hypothetical protein